MAGTHSGACVVVVACMWGFPLQEEAVREQNCSRTATVCVCVCVDTLSSTREMSL